MTSLPGPRLDHLTLDCALCCVYIRQCRTCSIMLSTIKVTMCVAGYVPTTSFLKIDLCFQTALSQTRAFALPLGCGLKTKMRQRNVMAPLHHGTRATSLTWNRVSDKLRERESLVPSRGWCMRSVDQCGSVVGRGRREGCRELLVVFSRVTLRSYCGFLLLSGQCSLKQLISTGTCRRGTCHL